jgi:anti-sigma B factor antagonist
MISEGRITTVKGCSDGRQISGRGPPPSLRGLSPGGSHIHAPDLTGVAVERVAPGVTLVRVRGEVDLLTAPSLRAELDYQVDLMPSVLIIDLTRVAFFGVSGVEVLIEIYQRARQTEILLRLVANTRAVARMVKILRLDRFFPIYQELADALTG